jgi:hypothetical protein
MLLAASVVLPAGKPSDSSGADVRLDWRAPAAVVIVVAGLFAWKTLDLDGRETLFRRTHFDGAQVAGLAHPLNVNFDHRLALMGYEPAALAAEVGGVVSVSLYWRALQPLDADYSISAQLVDERGWVYGQRDSQHPGGYPTSRWKTSGYARDVHEITLLPGTPPGRYRLRVGVYRVGVPGGLNVLDVNGAPAGTTFDVAIVQVNRRGWSPFPPQLARPQPQHVSGARLAPGLVLIGYDLPLGEIQAGANLPFTLYWQGGGDNTTPFPLRELDAQLELVGLDQTVRLGRVAPISLQFPTSDLQRGDVVRGPNSIRIPAFTPGGNWTVRLALVDQGGVAQGDAVDLGRVTVQVPARTMVMPPVQYPLAATIDPVRLVGYDVSHASLAPGATLTVTLYWQAQREMTTSAKSFVHLLDAAGRLAAGSDAVPANWTRPTTGWIAGEYVVDPHTFLPRDLAPGAYRLEVGLYDAASGARLGDGIVLDRGVMVTRP